jgi:hypothetical protein
MRLIRAHSGSARSDIQCLSNKLADSDGGDKVPVNPVLERAKNMRSKQLFAPEGKNHGGRSVTANLVVSPHEKRNGNGTDISHGLELLF